MATKNIVPNADSEGGIGTSSKYWATGYIDAITTTGNLVIGGNTGIGDSSPSQKLVVEGDWNQTATNNNQLYIQGSTNSNMQLRLGYDTTGDHGYIQAILNGTGGRELHLNTSGGAVVIADSGNIGCASDTDLLTLASGALTVSGSASFTGNLGLTGSASNLNFSADQDASITMSATTSGTDGRDLSIFAGASSNTDADNGGDLILRGGNAGANGSSQIRFRTATTSHAYGITAEHLRIDSSGHIAIPRTFNDTSNQPVIYVDSTISSGASTYQGSLLLQAGGAGSASYGAGLRLYGHAHASSPGSVEVGLSAVSGATFTVDSFGAGGGVDILKVERDNYNTTIAGNLVIGTAGKGIDFSATSDGGASTPSELLDDYEEGTWTPSYVTNGVASTVAYNIRNGFYTKVGNQVTCWGNIQTNATTWNGDYVQLDGQPFAAANTTMPIGFIPYSFGFAGDHPGGIYYATSTRNYLTYRDAADGQTNELLASDMNTGNGANTIIFSFTFQTTS